MKRSGTGKLIEVCNDRHVEGDRTAGRDKARGIRIDHVGSNMIADIHHAVHTVKREIGSADQIPLKRMLEERLQQIKRREQLLHLRQVTWRVMNGWNC